MCAGSDDLTDAALAFSKGKGDTHTAPKHNGNGGGTSDTTEVQPATYYCYNNAKV
jgi:hypothetical protein